VTARRVASARASSLSALNTGGEISRLGIVDGRDSEREERYAWMEDAARRDLVADVIALVRASEEGEAVVLL
jgi:hypothetical protein